MAEGSLSATIHPGGNNCVWAAACEGSQAATPLAPPWDWAVAFSFARAVAAT